MTFHAGDDPGPDTFLRAPNAAELKLQMGLAAGWAGFVRYGIYPYPGLAGALAVAGFVLSFAPFWNAAAVAGLMWFVAAVANNQNGLRDFIIRKRAEWVNDFERLAAWVRIAIRNHKSEREFAAMAQHQSLLSGRIMSPLRVITIGALILATVGVAWGGVNEFRIGKIKGDLETRTHERDRALREASMWKAEAGEIEQARQAAVRRQLEEQARTVELTRERDLARQQLAQRTRSRSDEIRSRTRGAVVDYSERLRELSAAHGGSPGSQPDNAAGDPAGGMPDGSGGAPGVQSGAAPAGE